MQEYRVVLTREALYDTVRIAEYIELNFGKRRADCFQRELQKEMKELGYMGDAFPKTRIFYRGYIIHKKPFPPSIIFYVLKEKIEEVHILRVLRQECDWRDALKTVQKYTYFN